MFLSSLTSQLDEFRMEVQRRDQEIVAMTAKIKTLEEQHADYQRHIAVLKEAIVAKEEHCNLLQADVIIFFNYLFYNLQDFRQNYRIKFYLTLAILDISLESFFISQYPGSINTISSFVSSFHISVDIV